MITANGNQAFSPLHATYTIYFCNNRTIECSKRLQNVYNEITTENMSIYMSHAVNIYNRIPMYIHITAIFITFQSLIETCVAHNLWESSKTFHLYNDRYLYNNFDINTHRSKCLMIISIYLFIIY